MMADIIHRQLYDALFGLYSLVGLGDYERDDGEPPIIKDGIKDQIIRQAAVALHDARETLPSIEKPPQTDTS